WRSRNSSKMASRLEKSGASTVFSRFSSTCACAVNPTTPTAASPMRKILSGWASSSGGSLSSSKVVSASATMTAAPFFCATAMVDKGSWGVGVWGLELENSQLQTSEVEQGGEEEEHRQPEDVVGDGDERPHGEGGVDADAVEQERGRRPEDGGDDDDDEEREAGGGGEVEGVGVAEDARVRHPDDDGAEDDGEDGPVEQRHGQLLPEPRHHVARPEVARGEPLHGDGRRLDAGVARHRHHDGDEHG